MASILRVKDSNGNIIDIPTIKGDKGDSYVLTEADKMSIKDAVISELDIPVCIPVTHELPSEAADGDMCLYSPANIITLEDSGKRIYFDWEEFRKPIESEGEVGVEFTAFNYNPEISFEVTCYRSANGGGMSVIVAEGNGNTMLGIEFADGNLINAMKTINKPNNEYEEHHYNSIDELPLYEDIPKGLTGLSDNNRNTAEDNFMFCTEYKLMKYQGGEWAEVFGTSTKDYIDNALADINTRIDEVAGGIDEALNIVNETNAIIDESGVLE